MNLWPREIESIKKLAKSICKFEDEKIMDALEEVKPIEVEIEFTPEPTPLPAQGWILTYTGKKLYPLHPRVEDICIRDIAHGLSNICRFGGQCRDFYSVAQHCVLVSHVSGEFALHGLLHDAAEGMGLMDIPTPVKKSPELSGYRALEDQLQVMIYRKFSLDEAEPKEVKQVDSKMFVTEALCLRDNRGWQPKVEPYPFTITPLSPKEAEQLFLNRFAELMREQRGDEVLMRYLGE